MKIRLLDFSGVEHFVEIPDDTNEITIKVISGDMVMTSPFRYDTSDDRLMNYYDGEFTLQKQDFHVLDEVKNTHEFMCVMYGDEYEDDDYEY